MVKLKYYESATQSSWAPMPKQWVCGTIGPYREVGCGQPWLGCSMMYLVGPSNGVGGAQWICADCCSKLGFIW